MNEIEKLAFALQHFAGLEEYDFQPSLVVCLVGSSFLSAHELVCLVGNSHLFP